MPRRQAEKASTSRPLHVREAELKHRIASCREAWELERQGGANPKIAAVGTSKQMSGHVLANVRYVHTGGYRLEKKQEHRREVVRERDAKLEEARLAREKAERAREHQILLDIVERRERKEERLKAEMRAKQIRRSNQASLILLPCVSAVARIGLWSQALHRDRQQRELREIQRAAATVIQRKARWRIFARNFVQRVQVKGFFKKYLWYAVMGFRIRRKIRATKCIKAFQKAAADKSPIVVHMHQYFKKILMLQRLFRRFLNSIRALQLLSQQQWHRILLERRALQLRHQASFSISAAAPLAKKAKGATKTKATNNKAKVNNPLPPPDVHGKAAKQDEETDQEGNLMGLNYRLVPDASHPEVVLGLRKIVARRYVSFADTLQRWREEYKRWITEVKPVCSLLETFETVETVETVGCVEKHVHKAHPRGGADMKGHGGHKGKELVSGASRSHTKEVEAKSFVRETQETQARFKPDTPWLLELPNAFTWTDYLTLSEDERLLNTKYVSRGPPRPLYNVSLDQHGEMGPLFKALANISNVSKTPVNSPPVKPVNSAASPKPSSPIAPRATSDLSTMSNLV